MRVFGTRYESVFSIFTVWKGCIIHKMNESVTVLQPGKFSDYLISQYLPILRNLPIKNGIYHSHSTLIGFTLMSSRMRLSLSPSLSSNSTFITSLIISSIWLLFLSHLLFFFSCFWSLIQQILFCELLYARYDMIYTKISKIRHCSWGAKFKCVCVGG